MLQGIRHLWFITAIMFAYSLTPILQYFLKYANLLFPLLLFCIGVSYVLIPGQYIFIASWFFLYAIGYLYNHLTNKKIYNIGLLLIEIMLLILIAIYPRVINLYFHPLNRLLHDVSGAFVVFFGICLLSKIKLKNTPRIIEILDRYSFHIFIIHYFFVIGPFSLAYVTPYKAINILFMLVITVIATFIFVKFNDLLNKLFFDKLLKN